ncbi:UDP-3-O-[3-hydroxymyristoyl] glucosamine N-acyltransferase [Alteromonadaceae bacterium 2753L.S.0a.02]|nr:UDP-3-O-[3-hydroxymyristoyl] glucosamine N-acyltransferase [Alteromonadaceae bacterium 2753L.S.0a.02]
MSSDSNQTLEALANFLGCNYEGDGAYHVDNIASLESACSTDVTFVAQEKYLKQLADCRAGIVVLKPEHNNEFSGNKLLVSDPYSAYARLSSLFDPRTKTSPGIHPSAIVDSSATLGEGVAVAANCVIGANANIGAGTELGIGCVVAANTRIGADCLLHANVTLYEHVMAGDRVIIHSGAVIGSDGFGFAPSKEHGWVKIHQLARVIIGNDVEIGSNSSIDRGALHDTVIENGVIIDNLVHIAHGVCIGENTAIAACVGIAGSTTVGKNCTIAGAVGITGHINIADNTHFLGGTIVSKGNTEPGVFGSAPRLQSAREWRRNAVRYTQLDDLAERIKKLEKSTK